MQDIAIPGLPAPTAADSLNRAGEQLRARLRTAESSSAESRDLELKKAAHDFEALFVSYLLKVMRETIEESGLTEGGLGKGIYTELFDEELARAVSQRGPLGLSDLILKGLSSHQAEGSPAPAGNREEGVARPGQSGPAAAADPDAEIPDFMLPVQAPVSSGYGLRGDPLNGSIRFHKGIDLAAPAGTEVRAALDGRVLFAGFDGGYGNTVVIQHGDIMMRYAHLGATQVRTGDEICGHATVGIVGSTGRSTGPHLHFEVTRMGESVDPASALAE
jgi:murein DD-endopeptidase MepM/ murein hydrolase activator NlpD